MEMISWYLLRLRCHAKETYIKISYIASLTVFLQLTPQLVIHGSNIVCTTQKNEFNKKMREYTNSITLDVSKHRIGLGLQLCKEILFFKEMLLQC